MRCLFTVVSHKENISARSASGSVAPDSDADPHKSQKSDRQIDPQSYFCSSLTAMIDNVCSTARCRQRRLTLPTAPAATPTTALWGPSGQPTNILCLECMNRWVKKSAKRKVR